MMFENNKEIRNEENQAGGVDDKRIYKSIFNGTKKLLSEAIDTTQDKILPVAQQAVDATVQTTQEKVIPTVKEKTSKVVNKVSTSLTPEQMQEILDLLYGKSIDGVSKVSLPVDDLVLDYLTKNEDAMSAAKSLINNSTVKCGTSGFASSFGGFLSMIATLPANITSVLYVQLRMCCAIAKMGGYDIRSDQVKTLVYACLTGSAMTDVLKQSGIKFANKLGAKTIERIPAKTLTAINQKVGFRFVTKFGQTGIINLGKVIPVVGGIVGGGIDVASTRIIGRNAVNLFLKGEIPDKEDVLDAIPIPVEVNETVEKDIDDQMLEEALEHNRIEE